MALSESSPGRRCSVDVVDALLEPSKSLAASLHTNVSELAASCRHLALSLRRLVAGDLQGMFDGPSSVRLDAGGTRRTCRSLTGLREPSVLAPTMVAAGSWLNALLRAGRNQHLLVLDETWQVLADPGIGRWLRATMKLARAFGAAVVLVTHGLSDFRAVGDERSEAARLASALVADTASSALLAHGDAAIVDTVAHLGLSGPEADLLGALGRGIALWHVGRATSPSSAITCRESSSLRSTPMPGCSAMTPQSLGLRVLCTAGALVLGITLVITAALGGASATVGLSGAVPAATSTPATPAPSGAGDLSVAEIARSPRKPAFPAPRSRWRSPLRSPSRTVTPTRSTTTATGRSIAASGRSTLSTRNSRLPVDYDPLCAAKAAFSISAGGTDWEPWVTYQHGAGDPILPEATAYVRKRWFGAMSSLGRSRRTAKGGIR